MLKYQGLYNVSQMNSSQVLDIMFGPLNYYVGGSNWSELPDKSPIRQRVPSLIKLILTSIHQLAQRQ